MRGFCLQFCKLWAITGNIAYRLYLKKNYTFLSAILWRKYKSHDHKNSFIRSVISLAVISTFNGLSYWSHSKVMSILMKVGENKLNRFQTLRVWQLYAISNCSRLSCSEIKGRVQGHSMFLPLNAVKISKILYNWSFFWNGRNIVDLISWNPEPCSSWLYCNT